MINTSSAEAAFLPITRMIVAPKYDGVKILVMMEVDRTAVINGAT